MNSPKNYPDNPLPWKQIVAKAVHDMRTPLSTIRTSLEILRMLPPDSDQYGKMLGILDSQVKEISGQLETLMTTPESYLPPPSRVE